MKAIRSLRILFLALAATLIPAASFGGVYISVNFAPPTLPYYEQPPCPEDGWIWTPGYWDYDEDGYYWVPGTWVPAPYEGALWTPPYWGWDNNLYVFHPGYWGLHVGYYGGVNYGYGYMGVGFVGGMWRGHDFIYNTAVMRVDERRIRNVYVDRDVVRRYTIDNDRRVSFSGGRDGIHHDPRPEERYADRDRHVEESQYQRSHENAARSDKSFYARNNGGRPSNVVVQRPMSGPNSMPDNRGGFQGRGNDNNRRPQDQNDRGGNGDPRSNTRGYDNRNTYTPPANVNNQNRDNTPRRDNNPGGQYRNAPQQERNMPRQDDPRSNARGYDNRNTYTPPPNAGNQDRNNNSRQENPRDQYRNNPQPQPGGGQQPGGNQQPGDRNPRYRNEAPQQQNPTPQFRPYNNPRGSQDNMQNRGGPPPQQQQQPQSPRGDQGGRGDHSDHGDRGHDRQH
jgi:hypothetical protein